MHSVNIPGEQLLGNDAGQTTEHVRASVDYNDFLEHLVDYHYIEMLLTQECV